MPFLSGCFTSARQVPSNSSSWFMVSFSSSRRLFSLVHLFLELRKTGFKRLAYATFTVIGYMEYACIGRKTVNNTSYTSIPMVFTMISKIIHLQIAHHVRNTHANILRPKTNKAPECICCMSLHNITFRDAVNDK